MADMKKVYDDLIIINLYLFHVICKWQKCGGIVNPVHIHDSVYNINLPIIAVMSFRNMKDRKCFTIWKIINM